MPVENPQGLSREQREKINKPYAHNTGPQVDYTRAKQALSEFDQENPGLWGSVTGMLAKPQE
jgi:hypothetical protein